MLMMIEGTDLQSRQEMVKAVLGEARSRPDIKDVMEVKEEGQLTGLLERNFSPGTFLLFNEITTGLNIRGDNPKLSRQLINKVKELLRDNSNWVGVSVADAFSLDNRIKDPTRLRVSCGPERGGKYWFEIKNRGTDRRVGGTIGADSFFQFVDESEIPLTEDESVAQAMLEDN